MIYGFLGHVMGQNVCKVGNPLRVGFHSAIWFVTSLFVTESFLQVSLRSLDDDDDDANMFFLRFRSSPKPKLLLSRRERRGGPRRRQRLQ